LNKADKKRLVQQAKSGDKNAELKLLELNQLGILEEAKNPDTSEDVAIEMLAELALSNIELIRSKAISLLLKLMPNKLLEKILERNTSFEAKELILSTLLTQSNLDVYLLMLLHDSSDFPEKLKTKILEKITQVRKDLEKNALEIMKLQSQMDELMTMKSEKFKIIESLFLKLNGIQTEKLSNKIFHDFKLDVELSYQSLKSSIE
jgi:hypothetical protein